MSVIADTYRERTYTAQDGLSLYFREYGAACGDLLPVLCLAGLTRNSKDFHEFALHLAPERRVICPDYRGRGDSASDPNWRHYDGRHELLDVIHLLAVTNLTRLVVVGTSFGGILAMALAAARPRVLAGVVLNDVGPELDPEGAKQIIDFISVDRPHPDWPSAAAFLRETFGPHWALDQAGWLKAARLTYVEGSDGQLHFDYDLALVRGITHAAEGGIGGPGADYWHLFRALRPVPTLALRGEHSAFLSAKTFTAMAEAKPDLERLTVPGVGHAPFLEDPETLRVIDAFLARL